VPLQKSLDSRRKADAAERSHSGSIQSLSARALVDAVRSFVRRSSSLLSPIQINDGGTDEDESEDTRPALGVKARKKQPAKKQNGYEHDGKKHASSEPTARAGANHLPKEKHRTIKNKRGEKRRSNQKSGMRIPRAKIVSACQKKRRHNEQHPHDVEIPCEANLSVNRVHGECAANDPI
jgi:hypothetical protein